MAKSELILVLEQIERDKGIPKSEILQMIESAVVSSLRKYVGKNAVIEAAIDPETAQFKAQVVKKVVEAVIDAEIEMTVEEARKFKSDAQAGDEIRLPAPAADFARIAAQTAKQLLTQKVRESERDKLYDEFKPKEGQLTSGTVHRFIERTIVVDIGKVEGVMPMREQIRRERYNIGMSVRCVILRVDRASQAPQILLSRAAPLFLERLLEIEVPEVKDKTISIVSIVRDPGFRAKVLVKSNDPQVDPVGACVGLRGSRIRSLMNELAGEKIDLIAYHEDPEKLIANALSPAQISQVKITDAAAKRAVVFVPEPQFAIAIGKESQNLELASRLIGWHIEIKPQIEKKAGEVSESQIEGLSLKTMDLLSRAGMSDVHEIAKQSVESLMKIEGITEKMAAKIIAKAKASLEGK